jgi:hypothetical protein
MHQKSNGVVDPHWSQRIRIFFTQSHKRISLEYFIFLINVIYAMIFSTYFWQNIEI